MNYKKIIIFIIITLVIIILAGHGYSMEEIAYKKQAVKNTKAYIEEKYGFTPKIKNTKCEKDIQPSMFLRLSYPATGYVFVKANDGNRSFYVYISGKEETKG